jgi:hypothetical protein
MGQSAMVNRQVLQRLYTNRAGTTSYTKSVLKMSFFETGS